MKKITDWCGKDYVVGLATDHGGFEMKNELAKRLAAKGIKQKTSAHMYAI